MLGFEMFDPTSAAGAALRLPLRLIPASAILPVLSGPNRGSQWIVGAGTHGCWLGRYERQEIERFLGSVSARSVVWDIGAHAGYFTLACARRCAHVVACEPLERNLAFLRRHVEINHLTNVSIVDAAISGADGEQVSFGGHGSSYQNAIGGPGSIVTTATIDRLVHSGLPAPDILKMDIEGGEVAALKGALHTLAVVRPTMMIAVHGADLARDCREILSQANYRVQDMNIATLWAEPV